MEKRGEVEGRYGGGGVEGMRGENWMWGGDGKIGEGKGEVEGTERRKFYKKNWRGWRGRGLSDLGIQAGLRNVKNAVAWGPLRVYMCVYIYIYTLNVRTCTRNKSFLISVD